MALTTTVAGASSDSYATVVEADSYVEWRGSDAWENAIDATKEGVLKAAVSVLDELNYQDPRSDSDQALRLPTALMTNSSGDYYIPERVKRAQAYLALYMLENPDMLAGSDGVKQVSVPGGFSITYGDDGGNGLSLPHDVLMLIDRYLWKGGPTTRQWNSAARRYE